MSGTYKSDLKDTTWALTKASRYLERGGQWTVGLREYCDRWLDAFNRLQAQRESEHAPPS